jgi:hypothetical protein
MVSSLQLNTQISDARSAYGQPIYINGILDSDFSILSKQFTIKKIAACLQSA